MSDFDLALLAGGFALSGVVLGGVVNGILSWRQRVAEDRRRWLADRRSIYANYLGIAASKLQEVDSLAVFLRYSPDDPAPSDEDQSIVREGFHDYAAGWEAEVQPALGEIQLLASERVAEMADRVSSALLDLSSYLETQMAFSDYYPTWFQARDLLDVLRNEMREELGLKPIEAHGAVRDEDFPWLPDRPSRESYVQVHRPPPNAADRGGQE